MARRPRKRVAKRRVARRPTPRARHDSAATPTPARRLNNLPTQLTTFIGREREIAEVKRLLESTRLLTLTGAGGCGKTRLALQAVTDCPERYRDGIWFVDLAPLADPGLVPNSVAAALDIPEQPTRSLTDSLVDYLRAKTLLLVLDNCEHLRPACQSLTDHLLRASTTIRILTTSREGLGVDGETTYRVPPLQLPDVHQTPSAAQLAGYDAIRLFTQRAALGQPGFTLTASNAPSILQICQRLDGMPLAIEFAAARVAALPVEQIAARLDDRFRLLTAGHKKTLPRQQTLRATLDWSHDLLTESERALFRRLAVFAGGFTAEAAENVSVGNCVEQRDIVDLLTRLVDKSLVVLEEPEGQARYRLLESVRQYGRDKLEESGESNQLQRQHRDWYLMLAEQAGPKLRGSEQESWLRRLEMEHDNLRAALEWSLADSGDWGAGTRLAVALQYFWRTRDYFSEASLWLQRTFSHDINASPSVRMNAMFGLANMLCFQRKFEQAAVWAESGLALSRQLEDNRGTGQLLYVLAWVAGSLGDVDRAKVLTLESLASCREAGDDSWIANGLNYLGDLERIRGDYDAARSFYEQCLAIRRSTGEKRAIAVTLGNLGFVRIGQGDHRNAAVFFRESLHLHREVGSKKGISENLAGFAGVAVAEGEPERAARLLGAAEGLLGTLGVHFEPAEEIEFESQMKTAKAVLGDAKYAVFRAEGRAMTLDQVTDYGADATPASKRRERGLLTQRERQVAGLVAKGLSNRAIATRLGIVERTAISHVEHIMNKLGLHSRAHIAAWAVRHGLDVSAET